MRSPEEIMAINKRLRDELFETYYPIDKNPTSETIQNVNTRNAKMRKLFADAALAAIQELREQKNQQASKINKKESEVELTIIDVFSNIKRDTLNDKLIELEMERVYDEYVFAQANGKKFPGIELINFHETLLNVLIACAKRPIDERSVSLDAVLQQLFPKDREKQASVYGLLKTCKLVTINNKNLRFNDIHIRNAFQRRDNLAKKIIKKHREQVIISEKWGELKLKKIGEDQAELQRRIGIVKANCDIRIEKFKALQKNLPSLKTDIELLAAIDEAIKDVPTQDTPEKQIEAIETIKLKKYAEYYPHVLEQLEHASPENEKQVRLNLLIELLRKRQQINKEKLCLSKELKKLNYNELLERLPREIKAVQDDKDKFGQIAIELSTAVTRFTALLEGLYKKKKDEISKIDIKEYQDSYNQIANILVSMNGFKRDNSLENYSGGVALWSKTHQLLAEKIAKQHGRLTLESSLAGYLFDGLTWGTTWSTAEDAPLKQFWIKMSEEIAATSISKDHTKDDDENAGWVHLYVFKEVVTKSAFYTDEWKKIQDYIKEGSLNGIKLFIYTIEGNTRDRPIYVLDKLPEKSNFSKYPNSYIFTKESGKPKLYFMQVDKNNSEVKAIELKLGVDNPTNVRKRELGFVVPTLEQIEKEIMEIESDETALREKEPIKGKSLFGTQIKLTGKAGMLREIIEQNPGHEHDVKFVELEKGKVIEIRNEEQLREYINKENDEFIPSKEFPEEQQRLQDEVRLHNKNAAYILEKLIENSQQVVDLVEQHRTMEAEKRAANAISVTDRLKALDASIDEINGALETLAKDIKNLNDKNRVFSKYQDASTRYEQIVSSLENIEQRVTSFKDRASQTEIDEIQKILEKIQNVKVPLAEAKLNMDKKGKAYLQQNLLKPINTSRKIPNNRNPKYRNNVTEQVSTRPKTAENMNETVRAETTTVRGSDSSPYSQTPKPAESPYYAVERKLKEQLINSRMTNEGETNQGHNISTLLVKNKTGGNKTFKRTKTLSATSLKNLLEKDEGEKLTKSDRLKLIIEAFKEVKSRTPNMWGGKYYDQDERDSFNFFRRSDFNYTRTQIHHIKILAKQFKKILKTCSYELVYTEEGKKIVGLLRNQDAQEFFDFVPTRNKIVAAIMKVTDLREWVDRMLSYADPNNHVLHR